MSINTPLSRIARQLTLRRMELTAVSATVLAFALTRILVGGTPLQESNAVALELVQHIGWTGTGVVFIAGEVALFEGYNRLEPHYPRIARGAGVAIAGLGVADVAWNVRGLAMVGLPETMLWAPVVESAGVVALVGAVLLARPSLPALLGAATRMPICSRQSLGTIAVVLIMVSSPLAPVTPTASAAESPSSVSGPSPALDGTATGPDGLVYYVDRGELNRVVAFDRETNETAWTWTADSVAEIFITGESNGSVLVGAGSRIVSLDATDGSVEFDNSVSSESLYRPSVGPNGSWIYAGTSGGTVVRVNATSGQKDWESNAPSGSFVKTVAADMSGGKFVYAIHGDNALHKLYTTNGTEKDSVSLASSGNTYEVRAPSGDSVYVSGAGGIERIYKSNLTTEWSKPTSTSDYSGSTLMSATDGSFVIVEDAGSNSLTRIWRNGTVGYSAGDLEVYQEEMYISPSDRFAFITDSTNNDKLYRFYVSNGTKAEVYDRSGRFVGDAFFPTSSGSSGSSGPLVNGTVENQNGQPVDNATVTVTGIDREELDADPGELDAEAQELLNELEDPTPPNWSEDRTLTGSDGLFTEADTKYVAAHEKGDWGLSRTTDTPNLGKPSVQLPANEEIALSVWDPDAGGLVQDGVNSDLPGGVDDDTDIVVESIDHGGGTVDTQTLETDTTYDTVIGGEHDLATTELPAGFYRVYPEGSPESSYVIVVGDPQEIANTIRGDLKDEAGQLSTQAERVRELKDRDVLKQYTTTTNEDGEFSVDVPDSVTRVSVQAHKTPPGMTEDPQDASLQDVRDYYAVTDYNGSYVMPAEAETHAVPANDITVDVVESEAPQSADLGRYANATEAFRNLLQNLSYSDLPPGLQQRLDELNREDLEETTRKLKRLADQNEELEQRVEELLNRDLDEITINDSSDAELMEQIQAQQQAINELRSTIETLESETEVSNGTATSTATFAQELTNEQVRVVANFQNGTSREVADEYITLDQSAGTIVGQGGTQIAVEEYPIGDASGVTFDYVVVTEDGIGETTTGGLEPGADSIGLDAISLSTLRPGPDEQVDLTLVGDDETQVTSITDVRAVGPGGEELDTSTEGADTATFTTDGEGRHYVEVSFQTASGENGTLTHRIAAGPNDQAMPPGIRVKDTPFGTVAVVGDGYEAGSAEVSNGGQQIDVTAQVGADEDAPARTHLYTHGTDLPPTSTLNVNIVRGENQRAVQRHIEVTAHLPAIRTENAVLYRNGEGLPREGEGKLADVSTSSDETTIVTVTDARGSLELKTNSNPGFLERGEWWIDRNTPELSLGVLGQLPALPTVPVPTPAGAIDTGPMQMAAPAPTMDAPSPAAVSA